MKLLTLVRHAQAADASFTMHDFDRPLTNKGSKQSIAAGNFLKENDTIPDLIITSPAVRAYQTAKIIAGEISYPEEQIQTDKTIYAGNENTLLELICSTSNDINHLLLCGHNPTMLDLTNVICEKKRNHFKKGYVLVLIFNFNDWIDLFNSNGKEKHSFEQIF